MSDLRNRLKNVDTCLTALEDAVVAYREIALEAIERLERAELIAEDLRLTGTAVVEVTRIPVVGVFSNVLGCGGVELGGRGKIEIRECEIKGGSVDIREFTCRRA